jgi:hypothetical protein
MYGHMKAMPSRAAYIVDSTWICIIYAKMTLIACIAHMVKGKVLAPGRAKKRKGGQR